MQNSGIKDEEMVLATCIVCGSDNYREIHDIEISPIFVPSKLVRCEGCGFFYANPRPEKGSEEDYYRRRYHEDQEDGYWCEGRIDVFKRSLREINRFLKKGRLIDVGCGMGYFMDLARSAGWDVRGAEISDYAVRHAAEKLHLDVIKGNLSDAQFEAGYFDVATIWNVLDQIYDPRANLIELSRVLKKGGYVFIRVPNLRFHIMLYGLYNRLRPRNKRAEGPPSVFHLYSFDKDSIKRLLESTGFSDVKIKTEPLAANVPRFVEIFGKKNERVARGIFNTGAKALYLLTLGRAILSPSIFVIARKARICHG